MAEFREALSKSTRFAEMIVSFLIVFPCKNFDYIEIPSLLSERLYINQLQDFARCS